MAPPSSGGGPGGGATERPWLALPVWSCPIWTKQPVAHYSEGLSPPIFSISGVRPPYSLSAGVYPSVRMPPSPLFSFAVMNDHWPSHWQLSSWCHIITVSPFRPNYQITPVLKGPGRLTDRPTKETQISKKRRTLKTPWILTDRQFFFLSWPWKAANYSQEISEKQRLSYFRKYRCKTSAISFMFTLSLFSGHSYTNLS